MKTNTRLTILTVLLCGLSVSRAQLTIPGDGSDGDFHPTASVEVDLSQAVSGNWNDAQLPADAGKGIYDRNQWAVVFKYQNVTIPEGVTVTFKNHASRAPVVWLVQGNVTIIGPGNAAGAAPAIDLNGKQGVPGDSARFLTEPGPGGFRGGAVTSGSGAGLGVGSEAHGYFLGVYGNPKLLPLIGGSGAAARDNQWPGCGGGGAILIACSGVLTLSGNLTANGTSYSNSWSGSGGAVRLVANSILGSGRITAIGANAAAPYAGRIRIECRTPLSPDIITVPETVGVDPGSTPVIWAPSNAPKVRILKVAAANAPEDPTAPLDNSADIGIQNSDPVEILAETTNFPIEGQVRIRAAAKVGSYTWLTATYVSGNNARATWKATHTFGSGFATLQARAIVP